MGNRIDAWVVNAATGGALNVTCLSCAAQARIRSREANGFLILFEPVTKS
jgi:hypothetical protein